MMIIHNERLDKFWTEYHGLAGMTEIEKTERVIACVVACDRISTYWLLHGIFSKAVDALKDFSLILTGRIKAGENTLESVVRLQKILEGEDCKVGHKC